MRLPGRLRAAIEVLEEMAAHKRPASESLKDWGLKHRFAGAGDRAAIGNLVYDALRRRTWHSYLMGADTPRAIVLSVAVREWGEDPAQLAAAFTIDKFGPDPLNDDEIASLNRAQGTDAPDEARAGVPEWTLEKFKAAFGQDWIEEATAMGERPSLDLRVNKLRGSPERAIKSLARFKPEMAPYLSHAIRLLAGPRDARTPNVSADEAYLKGWVEIQDLGSQIVSALVGASAGAQILDFCAGGGGKTLAMAADMDNKGQIFAYDADRSRLAPIYDRLKRAGARNVQVRPPKEDALSDLEGRMDKVVVDAPCTGSGTWRRRPDAKWRLTPDQLEARCLEQAEILRAAANHVKPGGELIYITCSLFPEENEQQVRRFLAEDSSFIALDMRTRWNKILGADLPAPKWFGEMGGMLTPASTQTDGFFVAILERGKGDK